MTKVIHIKDAPIGWESDPAYVYIGRPGKGLSGPYGNRHAVGTRCEACSAWHTRETAIALFEKEATVLFETDANYRTKIEKLKGKILICFCNPKNTCHGDVYVKLLDNSK